MDIKSRDWLGDTPYVLALLTPGLDFIDLDEKGWMTSKADLLAREGQWHLISKLDLSIPFSVHIGPGERGLYAARHIGMVFTVADRQLEVTAYGIGKVTADGRELRMWVLPSGQICVDDDVLVFGRALIQSGWGQEVSMARDETNVDGVQPQPAPGTASVPEENAPGGTEMDAQREREQAEAKAAAKKAARAAAKEAKQNG